jgi:hypothetical protein
MLTNNVCLTSVFGRRFRARSSRGEWRRLARDDLSRLGDVGSDTQHTHAGDGDEADSAQGTDSAGILTIAVNCASSLQATNAMLLCAPRQAVLSDVAFHGID